MKWTDTINPATKLRNQQQTFQINSTTNFNPGQITTNPPPRPKKLVARWSLDENSKLFCQWVSED